MLKPITFLSIVLIGKAAFGHGGDAEPAPKPPSTTSGSGGTEVTDGSQRPGKVFRGFGKHPEWEFGRLPVESPLNDRFYLKDWVSGCIWDIQGVVELGSSTKDPCSNLHDPEHSWLVPTNSQLTEAMNHGLNRFVYNHSFISGPTQPAKAAECWFVRNGSSISPVMVENVRGRVSGESSSKVCRLSCVGK